METREKTQPPKEKHGFFNEIKSYFNLEKQLFKLDVLEKMSKLLTFLAGIMVALVFGGIATAFLSLLLLNVFRHLLGSNILAIASIILFFLLCSVLVFVFRERLFLNFFIRSIHAILFQKDNKKHQPNHEQS
ncbi:MAG: phage holin family protein [Bacteroidales bacterium]|jgi:hypothetical protein|nr:phage holin family protein [Bacteroidales bacterium]